MRIFTVPIVVFAGLALAGCSAAPSVQVAREAGDTSVARVRGHLGPDEARAQLLFSSAEATLESGGRYFRVVGGFQTVYGPDCQTNRDYPCPTGLRDGTMVFEPSAGPQDGQGTWDALVVVLSSPPALRSRLSEKARRQLETFKQASGRS